MAEFFNFPPLNKNGEESKTNALINCELVEHILWDEERNATVLLQGAGCYATKWTIKQVWNSVIETTPKNKKKASK